MLLWHWGSIVPELRRSVFGVQYFGHFFAMQTKIISFTGIFLPTCFFEEVFYRDCTWNLQSFKNGNENLQFSLPAYTCLSTQCQEQLQPYWKIHYKETNEGTIQQNDLPVLSASKTGHISSSVILVFLISSRNEGSMRCTLLNGSTVYYNSWIARCVRYVHIAHGSCPQLATFCLYIWEEWITPDLMAFTFAM